MTIKSSIVQKASKRIAALIILGGTLVLSGCSTTTLPWPSLSISHDDGNEGLTKEEQSLLEQLLTTKQKNHRSDALREIEGN